MCFVVQEKRQREEIESKVQHTLSQYFKEPPKPSAEEGPHDPGADGDAGADMPVLENMTEPQIIDGGDGCDGPSSLDIDHGDDAPSAASLSAHKPPKVYKSLGRR